MHRRSDLPLFLSALAVAAAPAFPQPPEAPAPAVASEPEEPAAATRWRAQAELNLWRPAFQDDIALPGAGSIPSDRAGLEDNELTPLASVFLTDGEWTFELSGFVFGTDGGGASGPGFTLGSVAVAPGGTFDAEVDFSSVWVLATKRVWSRQIDEDTGLRLDLGGGLRAYDLSLDVSAGGLSDSGDSTWADAVALLGVGVTLPHDLSFDIRTDVGVGIDSASWSAGARIRWQPEPYLGAQFGYRILRNDRDDDGFEYDGAVAGLYVGLTFEF